MAEAKPTRPGQIMDVAHPGTSAPSGTSKPVIVTNRPMLKDPILAKADTQVSDLPEKELNSPGPEKSKVSVQPPAKDQTETATAVPTQDTNPADSEKAEPTVETHDSMESDEEPTVAKQTTEQIDAEAEQLAKHDAEIKKIVDSKEYYLPINAVEDRQAKRFILIGIVLSIILVVVWVDIALDAGLVKLGGVKALTHFFST